MLTDFCNHFLIIVHEHCICTCSVSAKKDMLDRVTGSAPSWMCPENLQWKVHRRHPDKMPEPIQLAPFIAKELYVTCLTSKAEPYEIVEEMYRIHGRIPCAGIDASNVLCKYLNFCLQENFTGDL